MSDDVVDPMYFFKRVCEPAIREWSEDTCCAGWIDGLEYDLWHLVKDDVGDPRMAHGEDVQGVLLYFVQLTGMWFHGYPAQLIPLPEWKREYEAYEQVRAAKS